MRKLGTINLVNKHFLTKKKKKKLIISKLIVRNKILNEN
jgi:hypothetical protein